MTYDTRVLDTDYQEKKAWMEEAKRPEKENKMLRELLDKTIKIAERYQAYAMRKK